VVLADDIRIDDLEGLMIGIRQMRGVLKVVPEVTGLDDFVADMRAKTEIKQKIYDVLREL
jgi:hypothetical protein